MILIFTFLSFILPKDSLIQIQSKTHVSISDAGQTPFWLRSLAFGQVLDQSPGLGSSFSLNKNYFLKKKYDFLYGFEANVWVGEKSDFFFSEAYAGAKKGKWELWVGLKKELYGLGDSTLSSGFYAWSGNALPLPKIKLATREYLPIFKNHLGIHMTYSHGWLDNMGALKGAFLHQKSLYLRLGKPYSRINLFGGLNHQVQWAGERKIYETGPKAAINKYPNSLSTYFYVITALKDRSILPLDPLTSQDDLGNQFGNHLGSIDVAMRLKLKSGILLLYKQSSYESGQIFSLVTADDGLNGISYLRNKPSLIDHINFEFLYTGNQGSYISWIGKLFNVVDTHFGEIISPFYNGGRTSGWTYSKSEIGTPLLMVDSKTFLNKGDTFTFNAVKSYYIGISGHFSSEYTYRIRASSSRYSSYLFSKEKPIPNQFSSSCTIMHYLKNKKASWSMALGYDQGDMLPGNVGLVLSYLIQLN